MNRRPTRSTRTDTLFPYTTLVRSDVFPERALEPLAKARILENPAEVVRRAPDILLGSWCGKKFRPAKVAARPGWDAIPAVRDAQLPEIKTPIILQPGPAALTAGVREIARIVPAEAPRPAEVRPRSPAHPKT